MADRHDEYNFSAELILSKVYDAQAEQKTCYLHVDDLVKEVEPDTPSEEIETFIGKLSEAQREKVQCVLEMPDTKSTRILRFFRAHPPHSITSFDDLRKKQIDCIGDIAPYIYAEFLKRLSCKTSVTPQKTKHLFIPLLSAGELRYVPEETAQYLQKTGMSSKEIDQLWQETTADRERRLSGSWFKYKTDKTPMASIRTCEQLDNVVRKANHEGHPWVVYRDFLRSLPERPEDDILQNIVIPLAARKDYWVRKTARDILERCNITVPFEG